MTTQPKWQAVSTDGLPDRDDYPVHLYDENTGWRGYAMRMKGSPNTIFYVKDPHLLNYDGTRTKLGGKQATHWMPAPKLVPPEPPKPKPSPDIPPSGYRLPKPSEVIPKVKGLMVWSERAEAWMDVIGAPLWAGQIAKDVYVRYAFPANMPDQTPPAEPDSFTLDEDDLKTALAALKRDIALAVESARSPRDGCAIDGSKLMRRLAELGITPDMGGEVQGDE